MPIYVLTNNFPAEMIQVSDTFTDFVLDAGFGSLLVDCDAYGRIEQQPRRFESDGGDPDRASPSDSCPPWFPNMGITKLFHTARTGTVSAATTARKQTSAVSPTSALGRWLLLLGTRAGTSAASR